MDTTLSKMLTTAAIHRLLADIRQSAPLLAARAETWMTGLTRTGCAEDYFQHPLAFPMLLLPCWVEEALQGQVDVKFQGDLIYSSVSGYYFIRMIDNVMDEGRELERSLLPLAGVFHAQATTLYHRYFEPQHPFWTYFFRWNTQSADFAIEDNDSTEVDLDTFQRIAGKKVVAGKIPVAAVLARYDQLDKLPEWETFYDKLSCWHQMFNDVLSWHKDIQHRTASYFLSEGQRRKHDQETFLGWLVRDGFAWGLEILHQWLGELLMSADSLSNRHLKQYLLERETLLNAQKHDLSVSLTAVTQLLKVGQSTTKS